MIELYANDANSTLAGAITNSATSAALSPGGGSLFPHPAANQFFRMTFKDQATLLDDEIVFVTNVTGDVITMTRGQEGTAAQAWSAGDIAANLCTAGAITNLAQAAQLQSGTFVFATDTGTVNAYLAPLTPAISAYTDGMKVNLRISHTNTGGSTLSVSGLTPIGIVGLGSVALQGGELPSGGMASFQYNDGMAKWILLYCQAGALQVVTPTKSQQAATFAQTTGRLLRTTVYKNVSGALQSSIDGAAFGAASSTFTPATGTTHVAVEVVGAGGGGGGGIGTGVGQLSSGGGGGGGGLASGIFTTGFSGVTVAVGAAGTVATASGGGTGGTSSFGALASATGGGGGAIGGIFTSGSAPQGVGAVAAGGAGTGGQVIGAGGFGNFASYYGTFCVSGFGGASFISSGALPVGPGVGGGTGSSGFGAGGGGGNCPPNVASGTTGGGGFSGLITVKEYA